MERDKNVKERKVDVANISKNKELNEESNLCFGEGGAGTFSDGKLYSRSNKRGNTNRIIEIFHYHGTKNEKHKPVFTLGKHGKETNLLVSEERLN